MRGCFIQATSHRIIQIDIAGKMTLEQPPVGKDRKSPEDD